MPLINPIIIAISGRPRSGKDTVCNYLMSKMPLVRYGPSVAVKRATAAMFNFPEEYLYDDKKKETVNDFWGMSYRQMAQMIGKECSRDVFGNNFWMRHVDRYLEEDLPEETQGIILADVRYQNELEWAKAREGLTINVHRTNRSEISNPGHAAEQGLADDLFNVVIHNNGSLKALYTTLDHLMANYITYNSVVGGNSTIYHYL
jgi:dephospho-CoA kinase